MTVVLLPSIIAAGRDIDTVYKIAKVLIWGFISAAVR